jgi:8-oxo-dGTP pyrophosphatase MutT (NUDIX family)
MKKLPDILVRLLLKVAYFASIIFCFVFRPATKSAIIAVWLKNKVLIIKNSYYHKYVIAGGYINIGENPVEAAVREVKEEIGIIADPNQLKKVCVIKETFNYKRETINCFELILNGPPHIQLDHREVVWAEFLSLHKALKLNLSSPVRAFLIQYQNDPMSR